MFKNPLNKNSELFPWTGKVSIYQFLKKQLDEHGKLVNEELPDEEELFKDQKIRFVAGAMDNLFGAGESDAARTKIVNELIKLVRKQVKQQDSKTRRATYIKVMDDNTLSYIDPFLDSLRGQPGIDPAKLYEEALWFAKEGAHRGAVKFGIALLGVLQCEQDKELLFTIGSHEEFTLYAAVALSNGTDNPNENLFTLAKSVHGWGKINVVERLEPETAEIKDWLLTDGCVNSIMNEYLAYTCAVKGELHKVLEAPVISSRLYQGAGTILSALIFGGPAEDINDYAHAYSVLDRYLYHSEEHCKTLDDFLTITEIHDYFLKGDEEDWKERFKNGWTRKQRAKLLEACQMFISDESWKNKAIDELKSRTDHFHVPVQVAKALELEIWSILFEKLKQDPENNYLYLELMRTSDRSRVEQLVAFAIEHLPLDKIASGPALEMGFGNEFKAFHPLDSIVQSLDEFDGVGLPLIEAALQSPVIRNRNMAMNALENWQPESWKHSNALEILKFLAKEDPDEELRERAKELIQK